MTCDKCGATLSPDAKFCVKCGARLANSTKKCVKCGCEIDSKTMFCGKCGANQSTYIHFAENQRYTINQNKPNKSKNSVLIISIFALIIIILTVTVIGLLYYINNSSSETETQSKNLKNPPFEEYEEKEKDNTEENTKNNGEEKNTIVYTPSYYQLKSELYSYIIDIPTHFVESRDSDESYRIFNAPDKTASIKVIVYENFGEKTTEQLYQERVEAFDGNITYKVKGDDWMVITGFENSDSVYYKIFNKDYIYEFKFTCDEEYLEIYKSYIEHIEDNFKVINQ